jgi:hypothetical protein
MQKFAKDNKEICSELKYNFCAIHSPNGVKNIAILFIYRLFCSLKMVILEKEAGE